jgi:hypothetical protein
MLSWRRSPLNGTSLLYAGYIGGSGYDQGYDVAVDGSGNAYVTGYTKSTGSSFPTKVGPDPSSNGLEDAFVTKINSSGSIIYSGFLGGQGNERGLGIDVDTFGNAYLTGLHLVRDGVYPRKIGPDLTANGGVDAFVAKIDSSGASTIYNGFIGGSGEDKGYDIAVDAAGNAYVSGYALSTSSTPFPVIGAGLSGNGNYDAFLAKVAANGASLVYSGFLGGANVDYGYGVAVDAFRQRLCDRSNQFRCLELSGDRRARSFTESWRPKPLW